MSLHYNGDKIICMWIKQRFANLRGAIRYVGMSCLGCLGINMCCLGSLSKDHIKDKVSEISLICTAYNFSVDHSAIERVDIIYLVKKNLK